MEKRNFVITEEVIQEGVRFTIHGHVDSNNSAELEYSLSNALKVGQTNIILNMLRVDYLCSTGIRVILKAFRDAEEAGGKLGIEAASERVRNVLGMVVLNELLMK